MDKAKEILKTLASASLGKQAEAPKKKIIPSSAHSSLREQFKKIFLPLLIDISELRLKLENYKLDRTSGRVLPANQEEMSPEEILNKLKSLQDDIEESRRWCEGVISQIERGISETKDLLVFLGHPVEETLEEEPTPRWRKLFGKKS